ncbi:MAG: YitT family protein [Bacilli bacterium]|nr:YitT family protein [Bacilli bacterium]
MRKFREKRIEEIIERVNKKNLVKRYTMLLTGCLIVAFSFNLFFLRYNIVCFGVSGVSIVLAEFGIPPSTFIMVANIILLIISYFFLGIDDTKGQILGSLVYPVFISLTAYVTDLIDLSNVEMIVIAVLGGVLAGVGYGLIYKSGYGTGGTDIMGNLVVKYSKISMGTAMMFINISIIVLGKIVFNWKTVMYAIVVAYLISIFTDKILLGISDSKAFYIVVPKDKDDLVRDFLISLEGVGSTIIDAHGGYSDDKKTLILAVVPTKMYFLVKEGLSEIDKDIFYLVCDSYEVSSKGGAYV